MTEKGKPNLDGKSVGIASMQKVALLKQNFSISNVSSVFREQMGSADLSKRRSGTRVFSVIWTMIRESRNPWYYWYTGSKAVAVQAWVVSFLIMFMTAVLLTGGLVRALIYVLVGVALESLALIVLPLVFLIDYYFPFPDQLYPTLIYPILISALVALIFNRVAVFIVLHSRSSKDV